MADIPTVKKRFSAGLLSFLALLCVLLGSLYLLSSAAQNNGSLGAMYNWLLIINGIGLFLIIAMIGVQARRLIRQRRANAPGSRLTLRITAIFVLLSLIPVTVVYYFSQQFIHRGIDTWMDVRTEHAIESSLDLTRASLDLRMREHLRQTQQMMDYIGRNPLNSGVAIALDELRQQFDAEEVVLLGQPALLGSGTKVMAYSHVDPTVVIPHVPDDDLMNRLAGTNKYVGLDPSDDGRLYVRVMVRDPNGGQVILQALFASPEHLSELANSVQEDYARYQELSYLRQPLKDTFTLTLRLVLLFSILSAVWAAFYAGRRMTAPIRALAEGTQAVAEGDYDMRLATTGKDDLGFLVNSFNDMTKRISQSRDLVHQSQQETEQQREYLETILAELSSGVLAFTENEQLRTANQAAETILGFSLADETKDNELAPSLSALAEQHPSLHPFINTLQTHLSRDENWREEITLTGPLGRRVLLCRGTPFSNGHVVVFDDITGLIQAQRDSAWGEVARRLAHEIKNPLTPIQLSAERIRHKFLKSMNESDAKILDRTTNTIVQQVESMKAMVNSFAEYARMPKMEQRPLDLNKLVAEVTDLYRSNKSNVDVLFQAADNQPTIEADEGRIRQLLHNLVKNSLDALSETENAQLKITTDRISEGGATRIELRIEDNGPGFTDGMLREGFQPYVTDKPSGTGLGLAIVKKITEEHAGMITLANGAQGGAMIRVTIPEMREMA